VIEINNNITEQLKAEAAWHELASIVESSSDAIISTTLDGVVASWNHSAELLFDYSSAEMIGESIDKIIPAFLQERHDNSVQRLLREGGFERIETVRLPGEGARLPSRSSFSPSAMQPAS
jgi:PAS domain S-box-containing protein